MAERESLPVRASALGAGHVGALHLVSRPRRVYVASSWRCTHQPAAVTLLRTLGLDVYDFRHPAPGNHGFSWSEIDPEWLKWTPEQFRGALEHPTAIEGYARDMVALRNCDACVLVLPCNRSAHLELGWAAGAGKRTAVYIPEPQEPELMYRMLDAVLVSAPELVQWGKGIAASKVKP